MLGSSAFWSLSLYTTAKEGGGSFQSSTRAPRGYVPTGTPAADPDRSRAEAGRRARAQVRRYCAASRLTRLATLTYGPPRCTDPVQLRADVHDFFRALRGKLGGKPFPYLWVPERHRDGVHFHVHFAVGRYIQRGLIEESWGRGFVSIKLLSDLPVGATRVKEARAAAGYLSKYVSKSFDENVPGLHRYEVAQGFAPKAVRVMGRSADELLERASLVMGAPPSVTWSSRQVDNWEGPPAVWFAWDS
jgi:hypothetical protein